MTNKFSKPKPLVHTTDLCRKGPPALAVKMSLKIPRPFVKATKVVEATLLYNDPRIDDETPIPVQWATDGGELNAPPHTPNGHSITVTIATGTEPGTFFLTAVAGQADKPKSVRSVYFATFQ